MKKKLTATALSLALLIVPLLSAAAGYSFPAEGVAFTGDTPLLITRDTIEIKAARLSAAGIDPAPLAADFAAGRLIFAALLDEGICVSLSQVATEDSIRWVSAEEMQDADRASLLSAFQSAPYENAEWVPLDPPCVRFAYALEAGGVLTQFAALITVQRGLLYRLTAVGKGAEADALHAANENVLGMIQFFEGTSPEAALPFAPQLPEPALDDGVRTPLALVGFTGVTEEDLTNLVIQTLPNTEVMLYTANDSLRSRAGEDGTTRFALSTKRETTYTYELQAEAPGRERSVMRLTLERRISAESMAAAYRKNAIPIERIGYDGLFSTEVGTTILFRGKAGGFTNSGAYPCVLVFTANPGSGVWVSPLWVRLTAPIEVEEGTVYTVYGDITGEMMEYIDENGQASMIPVVESHIATK